MLFGKRGESEAAPAGPATIDLALSFEPGYAILTGEGVRFRVKREHVETLIGRESAARKFIEAENPAHGGPFDQAAISKTAKIAHFLAHDLDMSQVARILGEREPAVRAYYSWGITQDAWNGSTAAQAEREKLQELDRVRSVAGVPGGTINTGGVLVSALTGVPVQQKFARLNAVEVSRTLRANKDDVQDTAKALQVDRDDLARWIEANGEMLAVLK